MRHFCGFASRRCVVHFFFSILWTNIWCKENGSILRHPIRTAGVESLRGIARHFSSRWNYVIKQDGGRLVIFWRRRRPLPCTDSLTDWLRSEIVCWVADKSEQAETRQEVFIYLFMLFFFFLCDTRSVLELCGRSTTCTLSITGIVARIGRYMRGFLVRLILRGRWLLGNLVPWANSSWWRQCAWRSHRSMEGRVPHFHCAVALTHINV